MRIRETHINVRTTPQEKERFQRNAKLCCLSLSEYLRQLANGHEPKIYQVNRDGDHEDLAGS